MEERNKYREVPILQKRLAAFLLLKNCRLLRVADDKKYPSRSVFFFSNDQHTNNMLGVYPEYREKLMEMFMSKKEEIKEKQ